MDDEKTGVFLQDPAQYRFEAMAATAFNPAPYRRKVESKDTGIFRKKRTSSKSVGLDVDGAKTCHQLAREGDLNGLKSILEVVGSSLKGLDDTGATLLHSAVCGNQLKVMDYLIESGVAINARDENGDTALHVAVREGSIDALHLLLKNGASDVVLNSNEDAPIHIAARIDDTSAIEALLQHSIEIFVTGFRKRNALHVAAELDNIEVAKAIHDGVLASGTKQLRLCSADQDGLTAIHLAARNGSHRVLEFLIQVATEHGYSNEDILSFLDEENSTPLHAAIDRCHANVAEVLLRRGASPVTSKNDHPPPLHMACSLGKLEIVQSMVELCGAEILQQADMHGRTSLHYSANSAKSGKLISYITQYNIVVNATDIQGRTALHIAVMSGSLAAVKCLLNKGADPTLCDRNGHNTLHYAVIHNRKIIIGCLLELPCAKHLISCIGDSECTPVHYALKLGYGHLAYPMVAVISSQINGMVDPKGNNLLHLAAGSGDCSIVANLLTLPACETLLNETNSCGSTPLHCAAAAGKTGCVKVLLEHGATSHKCHCGITPFMYACQMGNTECAKLLHQAFAFQRDWADDQGNSCLHLSVSSGNPLTLQLVLDLGATINHNFDQESFFDLIIRNGDAVCGSVIVDHDRWQECLDTSSPNHPHIMIGLIQSMPDLAKLVLDRCLVKSTFSAGHPSYWKKFCFKYIRLNTNNVLDCYQDNCYQDEKVESLSIQDMEIPSIQYKGRRSVSYAPKKEHLHTTQALQVMVEYRRVNLLMHPVVIEYLKMKWKDYGRWIFSSAMLIHFLHIFLLSIFIAIVPLPETSSQLLSNENGSTNTSNFDYKLTPAANAFRILTLIFCTTNVILLTVNILVFAKLLLFLVDIVFWAHFGTILCTYIFLIPSIPIWPAGAVASFCGWFAIVTAMKLTEALGIYITMFLQICRTVLTVMIISFILLLSLSLPLHLLANVMPEFSSVGYSVFTSFGYMLGEIQYSQIVRENISGSFTYGSLLFVFIIVFAILLSIVIINLLIGLAVGDIEKIRTNAIAENVSTEINFFTKIDAALPIIKRYERHSYKKFPNAHKTRLHKHADFVTRYLKNVMENNDDALDHSRDFRISSNRELVAMRQQLQELHALVKGQNNSKLTTL